MKLSEALTPRQLADRAARWAAQRAEARQSDPQLNPSKSDIEAARAAAVKSPAYQKIVALNGFKDTSTPQQIKNGTINFKLNGRIDVQCTTVGNVRVQGPSDHVANVFVKAGAIKHESLAAAYKYMLNAIYQRFASHAKDSLDITEAPCYKPGNVELSCKYKGITTIAGLPAHSYHRIDLDGNLLKDLKNPPVSCDFLLVRNNNIVTLEGMPKVNLLDIRGNTEELNWSVEHKNLRASSLLASIKSCRNLSMLLLNLELREVKLSDSSSRSGWAGPGSIALSRELASLNELFEKAFQNPSRKKAMFELQQQAIEADYSFLDHIVHE